MKLWFCRVLNLAQDAAFPSSSTTIGVVGAIGAAVAGVWGWFRSELNDCKKDRKELYQRVDDLHEKVSELSMRVGQVEGAPKAG